MCRHPDISSLCPWPSFFVLSPGWHETCLCGVAKPAELRISSAQRCARRCCYPGGGLIPFGSRGVALAGFSYSENMLDGAHNRGRWVRDRGGAWGLPTPSLFYFLNLLNFPRRRSLEGEGWVPVTGWLSSRAWLCEVELVCFAASLKEGGFDGNKIHALNTFVLATL